MKTLTLIVLLFTSQFASALTASELDCLTKSVYHEARSLPKSDWIKVANVTLNRKRHFKEYNFGAKSSHICDIVRSRQYSSRVNLKRRIKEKGVFDEIKTTLLQSNLTNRTNALYFSTRNKKMIYTVAWRG